MDSDLKRYYEEQIEVLKRIITARDATIKQLEEKLK